MEDSFVEVISLGKARVIDKTFIPEETLAASERWLRGKPITWSPTDPWAASSQAIGQVKAASYTSSMGMIVTGILLSDKLSPAQLEAIKSIDGYLPGIGALTVITTSPETGSFEGKAYDKEATMINWDSVALNIPQVKGHSIDDKITELKASIAALEEEHRHYPFTQLKAHSKEDISQERLAEIEASWERRLGRRDV